MKLRNKKTGEIKDLQEVIHQAYQEHNFNSLAELNEEWEDYEEAKEYWFIRDHTSIVGYAPVNNTEAAKYRKDIVGNYFETKEEAEKAVEKLKAWKRLKDKGFRFIGVRNIGKVIDFDIPEPFNHVGFDDYVAGVVEKEFYNDLLFLFGGEE